MTLNYVLTHPFTLPHVSPQGAGNQTLFRVIRILKLKKFDLSYTLDGYMIASDKFIEAWEEAKGKGMSFTPLIKSPGYSLVNVKKYVEYEQENNKVRFWGFNNCYQTYAEILTGTPGSFNCIHKIEKFGAALSDLKFGKGDRKINLLYVSLSIGNNLEKYKKLTGFYSKIVNR